MVSLMLFLCLFAGGMFCPSSASAQKTVRQSEKMRPAWLSDKTPRPTNATFHYRTVEAQGNTLDEARRQCLVVLSEDVERTWKVSGGGTQDIREVQTNGEIDSRSVFTYHYNVAGEEVSITTTCYDEYWECVRYPDGALRYHCYMLFGVADTAQPEFDRLRFTRKYGARGLWRSLIIPGWGQMYNEVNELTYSGFCIDGVYTIYGSFYESDLNIVSYIGMIDEGVPFGLGQKFDRNSNLINEGVYVCDRWMESTQIVPNIVDSSFLLSSLVESLDLTDYAFCYMPCNFSCFPHLLKIKGSSNTFYRVQSLVLEGLQNLQQFSLITKELTQDNQEYELDENKVRKVLGRIEIRDCPQLLLIGIGDNCLLLPDFIIQSIVFE